MVINRVRQELNYGLHVAGLIVTQSDSRIGTHKRREEQVRSLVGANLPIFENVIPNNIDLAKSRRRRSAPGLCPAQQRRPGLPRLAEEIKHGEKSVNRNSPLQLHRPPGRRESQAIQRLIGAHART
ncbi:hypothetical protein [Candidatus Amarolinea dominans]|uniref:hypothetical protein n=1 Tax=Candidatus Amarolinea dominans TaxID=3140696 RepID=UPI0031CC5CD9